MKQKKQQGTNCILVVDFGSQTTHLIARRLKDLGAPTKKVYPHEALKAAHSEKPKGIVLSGSPYSVYEKNSPLVDKKIFDLGMPILGICYGFHATAHVLGGKVVSGRKEYGPGHFTVLQSASPILKGFKKKSTVWLSHGDEIIKIPKDFTLIGSTPHVPYTAAMNKSKHIYMIQFHPEVEHTEEGNKIFANFIDICGVEKNVVSIKPTEVIKKIQETVGDSHVIGAISGGVDSSVAGVLVAKAIGKRFTPIFVDNGLQREDAKKTVKSIFTKLGVKPLIVDVREEMLEKLKGKTDGVKKRKIIGAFYIEVFEREVDKLISRHSGKQSASRIILRQAQDKNRSWASSPRGEAGQDDKFFLLQGTIYSDVIESKGTKHASQIRVHHNVAGLPDMMKLQLLEPLRQLYKDEVRALGKKIGLPKAVTQKQAFPGPGYAVRIRGEVTKERLQQVKQADAIILEELEKTGWLGRVFMSFPVMTGAFSTGTKGDGKAFGEVIALRIIESSDVMSTVWTRLPYDLLQKLSSRIVNEVPGISRVVYDITTKPPATMEWE